MRRLWSSCLLITGLLYGTNTNAQINLSVNVGSQPAWGPAGYNHVDYYYLPDMNAYYYVPKKQFIYLNGNNWVFVPSPPAQYKNVNLYQTYKVVINQPKPFLQHTVYVTKYKGYKGNYGKQETLRDHRGNAYGHYKSKHSFEHKQNDHDNNGKGNTHGGEGSGKH